jgi:hypothetical protein
MHSSQLCGSQELKQLKSGVHGEQAPTSSLPHWVPKPMYRNAPAISQQPKQSQPLGVIGKHVERQCSFCGRPHDGF